MPCLLANLVDDWLLGSDFFMLVTPVYLKRNRAPARRKKDKLSSRFLEAKKAPEIRGLKKDVAVKERFELSIRSPVYPLSRRAPSATRTLHRNSETGLVPYSGGELYWRCF